MRGIEKPPEFNEFIHIFRHGPNEIIIGFIYFLIPVVLFISILDGVISEINLGMPSFPDDVIILFLIVGLYWDLLQI